MSAYCTHSRAVPAHQVKLPNDFRLSGGRALRLRPRSCPRGGALLDESERDGAGCGVRGWPGRADRPGIRGRVSRPLQRVVAAGVGGASRGACMHPGSGRCKRRGQPVPAVFDRWSYVNQNCFSPQPCSPAAHRLSRFPGWPVAGGYDGLCTRWGYPPGHPCAIGECRVGRPPAAPVGAR